MRKLVLILTVLILIVGIFGFWNWQKNTYSKDVLKLEILGPSDTTLGQEIEYTVKYKNNSNFRLDSPQLVFEAPERSFSDGQVSGRENLGSEKLGEAIYPGEEKTLSFKVRLLGGEGEVRVAKASLSYQPKNLKARYESSTTFATTIRSVPLTFEFDIPSQVEPKGAFTFRMNYFSNIDFSLTNLRLQVDYPPDFEFVSSMPRSLEKTEWEIPVLNKSQSGRVEITGRLSGEIGQAEVFRAKLGIWRDSQFILLKEAEKAVEVIKPSVYLRQEINGNPQYAASPGDWLHYEIYFKNIGEDDLNNLFMINQLEGDAFDFSTLKSDLGIFQPGDNSVVFDWKRVSKLRYLAPMEEEKVDFWIKLKDDLGNVKNPILRNKVFVSQVKQEFATKISSKMEMAQKGYYQDEVFGNSGPIPPAAGQTTTYTISWQAKNYYSDVKDAKIKAILPPGAELTGKIFPEEEASKFSFDSQSREIIWLVGDIGRGKGVSDLGPNISFQVAFTPGYDQKGRTSDIINQAEIFGEDAWTEATIGSKALPINTTLPDDKTMTPIMGIVQ
ncbi:MAG: hypothetical protein Q7K28_01475 [Candidatus Wildermuthbacteria bacterium]|nr:hypothetical protein [Candidatus Wildermuthbacteria bacterium]